MLLPRFVLRMACIAPIALAAGAVSAQDYPNKPIRIVTGSPGSGGDFVTRLLAEGLPGFLRQPVIVENRGGAISGLTVAKAPPDGYTLLLQSSTIWIGPLLGETPYDPVRDFLPITLVTVSPNILIVHPSLPVASVKELIALAKAKPGALNYASGNSGGSSHLAAELFKAMAGVNIVRIHYKSSSSQMADMLSGYVQLTFDGVSSLMPHVKSGKLRALAITSARPSALAPGMPTIAATVPGYESAGMFGLFAPTGTPAAIVNRLNQETVRFLKTPAAQERLMTQGSEAVGNRSDEFAAVIKADMQKWAKVIKDAGIRVD